MAKVSGSGVTWVVCRSANLGLVRLPRPLGLCRRESWLESKGLLFTRLGFGAWDLERTGQGWKEGCSKAPKQDGRIPCC